jgi:hypothetical protein
MAYKLKPIFSAIIAIFFFISTGSFAQNSDSLSAVADKKYGEKDFLVAAQLYQRAAQLDKEFKWRHYYNSACSYALASSADSAFGILRLSIESGWNDVAALETDPDLISLRSDIRWKTILEQISFLNRNNQSLYMWGMFFGILFILFFYNLFLFFSIRDKSYLWYALSIFCFAHFECYRTPDFASQAKHVLVWLKLFDIPGLGLTCVNFFMVFFLLFSKEFLNLKENLPKMVKWIRVLIGVFTVLSLVFTILFDFEVKNFVFLFVLLSYVFVFILGIVCWRKKFKPARFFVIANVALLVGVHLIILREFGIISAKFQIGVFRPDNIGSIVFYVLLSLALGDRINILKQEREEARDVAMAELENKVRERTEEVTLQKETIEGKQKEMLDSIRYAHRIQKALITSEYYIEKQLARIRKR